MPSSTLCTTTSPVSSNTRITRLEGRLEALLPTCLVGAAVVSKRYTSAEWRGSP